MQNLDCLVSRSPRASGASRGSIRTAWAASGRRPPPPSEGTSPGKWSDPPHPAPRSFFSLYSRVLFSWLVLNPARAEGLDFHLTIAVPLKSSGSSAVECLA